MKLIYIAGPYTKPDPTINTREAVLLGAHIRDAYKVLTFVPHFSHFEHLLQPRDYEYWMQLDFDWLRRCDALYRMPGESSGADREVQEASLAGIPVFFNMNELKAWLEAAK